MKEYVVSSSMQELKDRHPFPWQEQRLSTPGAMLVRLVDAKGIEVPLFEIAALCRMVTQAQFFRDQQGKSPVTPEGNQ